MYCKLKVHTNKISVFLKAQGTWKLCLVHLLEDVGADSVRLNNVMEQTVTGGNLNKNDMLEVHKTKWEFVKKRVL